MRAVVRHDSPLLGYGCQNRNNIDLSVIIYLRYKETTQIVKFVKLTDIFGNHAIWRSWKPCIGWLLSSLIWSLQPFELSRQPLKPSAGPEWQGGLMALVLSARKFQRETIRSLTWPLFFHETATVLKLSRVRMSCSPSCGADGTSEHWDA